MRAGIALGSNMGDRLSYLRTARDRILKLPGVEEPFISSAIYETEPVGCEEGAAKFLNAAIEVGYASSPKDLLRELRAIEQSLHRAERRTQNEPRTIDLDLLYFGSRKLRSTSLTLPHPRLHQRRFVLQPLSDVSPNLIVPGKTETISQMLAQLPAEPTVVRAETQW